jgi:tRNA (guanine37-N1)-methyltransferase
MQLPLPTEESCFAFKCFQTLIGQRRGVGSLRKLLEKTLSQMLSAKDAIHVYNSYDIVGDIAIVRLKEASEESGWRIAQTIMDIHKNVRTVLAQIGAVCGEFRLRKLRYIGGENKTYTVHKESACQFSVDVEECYFSPRLSWERMRVAKLGEKGEVVVNMFAGVGCFSIVMAKYSNVERVYSVDVNPAAVRYMRENVRINRVYGKVLPMLGEAKEIIEKRLCHVANRVLMPLPEKASEYLSCALLCLIKSGGWIHYYDFVHARKGEDAVVKVKHSVSTKLDALNARFEVPFGRIVRASGPNWFQVVLDVKVMT